MSPIPYPLRGGRPLAARRGRRLRSGVADEQVVGVEGRQGQDADAGPGERRREPGHDADDVEVEGAGDAQGAPASLDARDGAGDGRFSADDRKLGVGTGRRRPARRSRPRRERRRLDRAGRWRCGRARSSRVEPWHGDRSLVIVVFSMMARQTTRVIVVSGRARPGESGAGLARDRARIRAVTRVQRVPSVWPPGRGSGRFPHE